MGSWDGDLFFGLGKGLDVVVLERFLAMCTSRLKAKKTSQIPGYRRFAFSHALKHVYITHAYTK